MDLRHLSAVGKRLAVAGNSGQVGLDHLGISEDHREQVSGVTERDNLPILVSPELREREPTWHLHRVLLLRGNGRAAQDGERSRNGRQQPNWSFRHGLFPPTRTPQVYSKKSARRSERPSEFAA